MSSQRFTSSALSNRLLHYYDYFIYFILLHVFFSPTGIYGARCVRCLFSPTTVASTVTRVVFLRFFLFYFVLSSDVPHCALSNL